MSESSFLPPIFLSDYRYDLPEDKIAKFPLEKRDDAKLLYYRQGEIRHHIFHELPEILPKESFLVFNNTKVIPARLFFQKDSGAVIQLFLLHPLFPSPVMSQAMEVQGECVWECMIGNRKRWKSSDILSIETSVEGKVLRFFAEWADMEQNQVRFRWDAELSFAELIAHFGKIPLPPYMNRDAELSDEQSYQTVYSQQKGAVAAPTAGLHFTENVLENLSSKGIKTDFLTLHVGAGTFQPVKVENALEHNMHNEQILISSANVENLLANIGNTIAVGTTSLRALESLYWFGVKLLERKSNEAIPFFIEKLYPYQTAERSTSEALRAVLQYMTENNIQQLVGETEIFIFPSYKFRICSGIITNFHQPESTLLMLISALIAKDWKKIYQVAMEENYRFLSYGDSSLLML